MTDIYNPWAGLASYEDPATAERKLKFCGRDDDSYDLARLIMGNVFVTLYGKSGIGKTSLLNAGVFPELRGEQYSPDSLRLGIRDEEHPQSYQSMIIDAIGRIVKRIETVNVIAEQKDEQSIDYLWNYFARHRFYDKNDEPTTPVFVFDQFEEVFRGHRDEAEILLKQLDYINDKDHALDRCEIDGQTYRYEQNFRFVVSIREDDLYLLEDSIDNCYLPALKRCRYRLRSLSEDGARDAILIPGKGLFNPGEEDAIAKSIISKSRNDDGSISTNIISLLCSRIYVDYKKSGENHITPLLVDNFLKGNPFEQFYNEATRGFSDREKSYIEDNFVDSTGRRNSIPESNFLKHVPNGAALLEGDKRILQRTSTSSDGKNNRVELIHDSFCAPLSNQKEKREKRKRLYQLALVSLIAILSLSAIVYVWSINQRMRTNESRVLAEKASALIDQGDSYLARLLALEALNRPYTPEAEYALRQASHHNTAILRGHINNVTSASFSPDGRYIASTSWDNTIKIWDARTGKQLHNIEHERQSTASFSPDGRYIVSASWDGTIRIWDAKTGLQKDSLLGHTELVLSAAFSPDGKYIVSASWDNTVRIWDAKTGLQVDSLLGHTGWVDFAAFSPDGKYIVSASEDSTVRIWDAKTSQQVRCISGHTDYVHSASFSPDGKYIVSASDDNTVRIWDAKTGQQVNSLLGHIARVCSAVFSPDGRYVVSASYDNTIRIWDVRTGQQVGRPLEEHHNWVNSAEFSPDGRYIVSASYDKTIRIFESKVIGLNDTTGRGYIATFSPDGKYIVSASYDNTIRIWDAKTGQQVGEPLVGHTDAVKSASFSPDGRTIVSASADNTVRIWDAKTGQQVGRPLEGHTAMVRSASFSPDGRYIVSASGDKTVRIWDVKTGQQLDSLLGHTRGVNSAAFSPDGRYIVSASDDNTVRIWDAKTGQQVDSLLGHTLSAYFASFSHDGRYIVSASGDNSVRIWDTKMGQQMRCLSGHTDGVLSASFSPDGKYIVSASLDMTVRVWDAQTGVQIDCLLGHTINVTTASFSPDGRYIVSASADGTVKIWDFPPLQELIDSTRERFKDRELTQEEKRKYYLE